MKIKAISLIIFLNLSALIADAAAAKYPFPQNIKYPFGYVPKTITADWVKTKYDEWLKTALTTCGTDKLFITTDGGYKVEAIGFAAFIFAYMGDSARFASTYNFYKANLTTQAGGMMGWRGSCSGPSDQGGATDGDVDVALGLIVASWQWPNAGYLEKAKAVITVLKKMIDTTCSNHVYALRMGYNFGGCSKTDISYYNPAAFREYAKAIGNAEDSALWIKLADDTYTILNAGANATTGLVPDQQTTTGGSGNYGDDACRTPWRITLDYLWNGNEKAKEWCIKISNFAFSHGIKNLNGPFSLSGQSSGGSHESKYVGGFAVAAMANSQAMVDSFGTDLKGITDQYNWFTKVLKYCYLITFTGNQWRPGLGETVTLKKPENLTNDAARSVKFKHFSNHNFSIEGLQPGYSVIVTSLSGKRLFYRTSAIEKMCLDISFMQSGCTVISVLDKDKNIFKRSTIPILR
jgi:endoglucanase